MITVRRNFVPLTSLPLTTVEDMAAVAQLIRQRILERTARGVDASGQPFQPYSEGYAARKREELGTGGTPDLTVSGGMLNAIVYEVTDRTARLYFSR